MSCTAGLSALFTPSLLFVVSSGQRVGYSIFLLHLFSSMFISLFFRRRKKRKQSGKDR